MWQIHYRVTGEHELGVECVATETEMLTAVRERYSDVVVHVVSPGGQRMTATHARLLSMLYDAKAHNVPPQPSATIKRMLAPEQVRLPKLPGINRGAQVQKLTPRPLK